jgi:hypothetical protein
VLCKIRATEKAVISCASWRRLPGNGNKIKGMSAAKDSNTNLGDQEQGEAAKPLVELWAALNALWGPLG